MTNTRSSKVNKVLKNVLKEKILLFKNKNKHFFEPKSAVASYKKL